MEAEAKESPRRYCFRHCCFRRYCFRHCCHCCFRHYCCHHCSSPHYSSLRCCCPEMEVAGVEVERTPMQQKNQVQESFVRSDMIDTLKRLNLQYTMLEDTVCKCQFGSRNQLKRI